MFKTKKDVDKHVTDILSKIKNEKERNLRGFTFARHYYDAMDYETAKKYLAGYLYFKETNAPAHKLMGEIYEKTGHLEKALISYKRSLEINENQKDVVLKICAIYCKLPVDPERARYWADRAERLFPHSEIVFQLRESMVTGEGEQNTQELEDLIINELLVRPSDVNLRMKLLKLYLDTERIKEAYEHTVEIEKKQPHYDSRDWYYCLVDVYEAYLEEQEQHYSQDLSIHLLQALDRLVFLNVENNHDTDKENRYGSNVHSRTWTSASALQSFDQHLLKAWQLPDAGSETWKAFLDYMQGQLYFHMATIILKRAKQEHGNRKEASRMGAALLLAAYSFKPPDLRSPAHLQSSLDERKWYERWHDLACYRLSQSGHVIIGMCHEDRSKWLGKMRDQVSTSQSKDRIYQRVFNSRLQNQAAQVSYFLAANMVAAMSEEFPDQKTLQEYDTVAHTLHPGSLHHLVWLALQRYNVKDKVQPIYGFRVFEGLQYSVSKLENPSPESLCYLDVEAFLYATVRCSALALEEQQSLSYVSPDTPPFLPASISEQLCTEQQAAWWRAAHDLFTNSKKQNLGQLRRTLQLGIEVIRTLGNHGMDVNLVIHLAETFADKAAEIKAQTDNDGRRANEIGHLEARAALYWKSAIVMLERISKNLTLMTPKEFLFPNYGRELSTEEVNKHLEAGKFFLACLAMNKGLHEQAISAFENLCTPYASFYQSLTYKKLAAEEFGNKPRESITSEMRSRHIILLTKARDALYVTMDRVRADKKHPLNQVLQEEIEDIETRLARIDPDTAQRNEFAGSEDSFSQDSEAQDPDSPTQNYSRLALSSLKTPIHETPRHVLTFPSPGRLDDAPGARQGEHLRPSPERLDAQIRSLAFSQSTVIKTMVEHNQALLETNRCLVEELKQNKTAVEQLTRHLEELTKQMPLLARGYLGGHHRRVSGPGRRQAIQHRHATKDDDENEAENDEDYYDGYYYDEEVDYDGQEGADHENPNFHTNQAYVYPDQQLHGDYPYGQAAGLHGTSTFAYAPPLGRGVPPAGYPHYFPPGPGIPVPPLATHQGGSIVQGHPIPAVGSPYFQPGAPALFSALPFSEGQKLPEFNFDTTTSQLNGNLAADKATKFPGFQPFSPQQPNAVQPHVTITPIEGTATVGRSLAPTVVPNATFVAATPGVPENELKFVGGAPSTSISSVQPTPLHSGQLSSPAILTTPGAEPPTVAATTFGLAPHAFQIALPPQAVIVSNPSSALNSSGGLKQTSPSHIISGQIQTTDSSFLSNSADRTRKDTEETGSSYHEEDSSGPDFKPVIPLPAEVEVKTGEEDEKVLFQDRAKLFRYVDKEWKERGVGTVKILHNEETGRTRILMRRDQILKTCANHNILPDMILSPMKNVDKAWVWAAQDYADEAMRKEKFCIRFKTPEIGQVFKQKFELAKEIAAKSPKTTPVKPVVVEDKQGFGDKFRPKAGAWVCTVCLVTNDATKTTCGACGTPPPGASAPSQAATPPKLPEFKFGMPSSASGFVPPVSIVSGFTTPASMKFKFGFSTSTPAQLPPPTFAGSTQAPGFNFSVASNANVAASSATQAADSASVSQKNGFVFGVASTSPQPKPSGYVFGASPVKADSTSTQTKPSGYVFGASAVKADSTTPQPKPSGNVLSAADSTSDSKAAESVGPASALLISLAGKQEAPKFELGGFSFRNPPIVRQVESKDEDATKPADTGIAAIPEPTKPNPFAGFSFTNKPSGFSLTQFHPPASALNVGSSLTQFHPPASAPNVGSHDRADANLSDILSGNTFGTDLSFTSLSQEHAKPDAFKKDPKFQGFQGKGNAVFGQEAKENDRVDEFEPNVEFKPVVSLPDLIDVKTGEEDEEKLFGARSKLFRYIADTKEWKERGIGELKILRHKQTGRVRILMRREQVLKLCANHHITKDMKLQAMSTSEKAWIWVAHDFAEGEHRVEKLAAKFKNSEIARQFKDVFEEQQRHLQNDRTEDVLAGKPGADSRPAEVPISNLFQSEAGSWKCVVCLVVNGASKASCEACATPNPNAPTKSSGIDSRPVQVPISNLFQAEAGSWKCAVCLVVNRASKASCEACATPNPNAPTKSSLPLKELFKQKEGSWECTTCCVRNDANGTKCISCEAARPGSESQPTVSPFKFGFPPADKKSEAPEKSSGFTFGTATPPFKFGVPSKIQGTSTPVAGSQEFRFGTPQNFSFNFGGVRPKSPSKTPKSPVCESTEGETEEDTGAESESDSIHFHPVVPLPDKIEVRTGEEDEEVRYCHRAKLYRLVEGEWKERGLGDFKIMFHRPSGKVRLLMRREQILKICCNHYLTVDTKFLVKDDRSWVWCANDFSDNEIRQERLAIRFKTPELALEFKRAIDEAQEQLRTGNFTPAPVKTRESSTTSPTKSFSFQSDDEQSPGASSFSNVEIVLEKKATEEQKAKARKLQLPSNFYLYEQAPPCPGCRGCSDEDTDDNDSDTGSLGHRECSDSNTVDNDSDGGSDVAVVWEATPSEERIKRALELMLPPNFYNYEDRPPCPGCRGCLNEDEPQALTPAMVASPDASTASVYRIPTSDKIASYGKSGTFETPTSTFKDDEDTHLSINNTGEEFVLGSAAISSLSFADLSRNPTAAFQIKPSVANCAFAGVGSKIFGQGNHSRNADDSDDENEENCSNTTADPHFEPAVPLPKLITLSTGEEDEDKVFGHRSKLYRYDLATSQWKERGVGEIKILRHRKTSKFRILMRREQVHKIVCNHALTTSMELKPMSTNDASWCWHANDFSEEREVSEKFAVRFKTSEIATAFRQVFEQCQRTLSGSGNNSITSEDR